MGAPDRIWGTGLAVRRDARRFGGMPGRVGRAALVIRIDASANRAPAGDGRFLSREPRRLGVFAIRAAGAAGLPDRRAAQERE
jgi:hypothetical protein